MGGARRPYEHTHHWQGSGCGTEVHLRRALLSQQGKQHWAAIWPLRLDRTNASEQQRRTASQSDFTHALHTLREPRSCLPVWSTVAPHMCAMPEIPQPRWPEHPLTHTKTGPGIRSSALECWSTGLHSRTRDAAEGPLTTNMPRQGLYEGTFGIFILYGCVGAVGRFLRRQRRWGSRWAEDRRDTSNGKAGLGSRWDQSLATPEGFRRQTLPEGNPQGAETGENVLAAYVLRRAPISAGHHCLQQQGPQLHLLSET